MKYFINFILLLISIDISGQNFSFKNLSEQKFSFTNTLGIDKSTAPGLYQKAKTFIHTNERDSFNISVMILKSLYDFDSVEYSYKILFPFLADIERSNRIYYSNTILGKWMLTHSTFSGFTNTPTPDRQLEREKEEIVFTDSEAFFYKNELLVKIRPYSISNNYWYDRFHQVNIFVIEFSDNYEKWRFRFTEETGIQIAIGKQPLCVCGCDTYWFKKTSSNFIVRNYYESYRHN